MAIEFKNDIFHLYNDNMSYCIEITKQGDLMHTYWGERVYEPKFNFYFGGRASMTVCDSEENGVYSLETLPLEYPFYGTSDLREPAAVVELASGSRVVEPRFNSYKIYSGKPAIDGLPAVYTEQECEAQTLEILLSDKNAGVDVLLYYTVFEDFDAICRSTKIVNVSDEHMFIEKISSVSMDFCGDDYKYMHLYGTHAKEKQVEICDVHKGKQGFDSKRGMSSHCENPFMAVMEKTAGENHGNVYGYSLVYSGNHFFGIDSENYEFMRVQAGINSFNFRWKLDKGESFSSPEAVLVYSKNGLGDMSRTYHKLYRTRLCRGSWRDRVRPILINSWEAAYFNFNEESIINYAKKGAELGLELLVLDDGWFGKRDDDTTSLGDWFVDKKKLPNGLGHLADEVNKLGLKFGLWFEPEMISEESELFKAHPDWRIAVPGRRPHPGRTQYVLDLARDEVCDYVIEAVSNVLESANIEYVKWDMNRSISDAYSASLPFDRQGEVMHRYMLGLYRILETITGRFPNILFESCASGGGRYDPGMLYYMPQTWTSDNSNPLHRIHIQYGNSMVYPSLSMGAHVSEEGKRYPLDFGAAVAMAGRFGYERDITKLNDEETETVKEQVKLYKEIREIVAFGEHYRLTEDDFQNYAAWMYVSEDKANAVVTFVSKTVEPNESRKRVLLKGLDEKAVYDYNGEEYSGSALMRMGIEYSNWKDYNSQVVVLKKVG